MNNVPDCITALIEPVAGSHMSLDEQILSARKEIKPDGYDMSVGEIMNLYRAKELVISPAYQRMFRWEPIQKTRFIESLLLGIPVPPIFVFQHENGIWELIDGLQRVSTVLEFAGLLEPVPEGTPVAPKLEDIEPADDEGGNNPPRLLGTSFLPDLEGKAWETTEGGTIQGIGTNAQLLIRRARIRVEILRQEGSAAIKYELFQRLNTGGTKLTEQEVRNCTAIMIDSTFHTWLTGLASLPDFIATTQQTEVALKRQAGTELALRFISFRHVPYEGGLDVHEYLDAALVRLASDKAFDRESERMIFERTFSRLNRAMGGGAFKRWDGVAFTGEFLMSIFEVVAPGVAINLAAIDALPDVNQFIIDRARSLSRNAAFLINSGAGVRGTTRLINLLPLGEPTFRP